MKEEELNKQIQDAIEVFSEMENSAFPLSINYFINGVEKMAVSPGLSKREYFAGLAMQSLLTQQNLDKQSTGLIPEASVIIADLLIEALNKK